MTIRDDWQIQREEAERSANRVATIALGIIVFALLMVVNFYDRPHAGRRTTKVGVSDEIHSSSGSRGSVGRVSHGLQAEEEGREEAGAGEAR